jgi:hypothetical protein
VKINNLNFKIECEIYIHENKRTTTIIKDGKRIEPVKNELIFILTVSYGRTTNTYHKMMRLLIFN